MADDREKQASCPICGYTDTALDADALEDAMVDHMRTAHNQTMSVNKGNTDMKLTGRVDDEVVAMPVVATPETSSALPGVAGNNIGNNRSL